MNNEEIVAHAKALKKQYNEAFLSRAKNCLDNAGHMRDLAVEELIGGRFETAGWAAIMSVKMFASKKEEKGQTDALYAKALRDFECFNGELIINGKSYPRDIVMQQVRTTVSGKMASLMGALTFDTYMLIGCCYFALFPKHFLSYRIPYTWLLNYKEAMRTGVLKGEDFSSDRNILRIIEEVGYLMAALNCPDEAFPIPWGRTEMEQELEQPINWYIFD